MSVLPISVEAALLREVLSTDLQLNVGRELMVRVADVGADGRGTINLAGVMLDARLPGGVETGDELKLVVRDVSSERVVLQIQQQPDVAAPQPTTGADESRVELPDGGVLALARRPQSSTGATGEGLYTLALRYDAPNFGAIDMSFAMDSGTLRLALTVPAGASYDTATFTSDDLADALSQVTGRSGTVSVTPRREPLEVFA